MKRYTLLRIMSLLAIVLMTLHVTDDIVRGISPPSPNNRNGVIIWAVWLLGTVALSEGRLAYIIMFLGGLFAAAMPVLHMGGRRYPTIATSSGGFFFIWTLYAVGTLGVFCIVMSAYGLWTTWGRKPVSP